MQYIAIIVSVLSALFTGGTLYDQWRTNYDGSRSERYLEASKIACWPAIICPDKEEEKEKWGVYVVNASSCPVWKVGIETEGWNLNHFKGDYEDYPIRLSVLPPGDFFIEHNWDLRHRDIANRYWDVARSSPANLNPKTRGRESANKILSISFEDRTKTKWVWSPTEGLRRVNPKPVSGIATKLGIAKAMQ